MEFQTLVDKADFTAEIGRATATYLSDILRKYPDSATPAAIVLQERIRLCNDNRNLWFAKNVKAQNGDRFDASGRYWRCNSIVCSGCQQLLSRDKRRRLRNVIRAIKLRVGEKFKFITFTVPNQNLSLTDSHNFVDYAFSLFRKRKWFNDTLRGSVKSFEFTKTSNGLHFHVHMLAIAKYISFAKIRTEWTECVQASAMKHLGRELTVANADRLLRVVVDDVRDLDGLVFELCKYITKSDSWTKVDQLDLLSYATAERLPRLFEMLGDFRLLDQKLRKAAQSVEANEQQREPIVHKTSLNDGGSQYECTTWRHYANLYGVQRSIERLHAEFENAIANRREHLERRYATSGIIDLPYRPNSAYSVGKAHRSLTDLYQIAESREASKPGERSPNDGVHPIG